MDRNELIKKTPEELAKLLFELKQELFVLKFQASIGKLESPAKFQNIKKEIARIKTIQVELNKNLKRIPKSKKTLEKIRLKALKKENPLKNNQKIESKEKDQNTK